MKARGLQARQESPPPVDTRPHWGFSFSGRNGEGERKRMIALTGLSCFFFPLPLGFPELTGLPSKGGKGGFEVSFRFLFRESHG